jgi:hypothetical protein
MPYAKRPLRHVPRVFFEDGDGDGRPAKCVHCDQPIAKADMVWSALDSDPMGLARPVHARCDREYSLFALALGL